MSRRNKQCIVGPAYALYLLYEISLIRVTNTKTVGIYVRNFRVINIIVRITNVKSKYRVIL